VPEAVRTGRGIGARTGLVWILAILMGWPSVKQLLRYYPALARAGTKYAVQSRLIERNVSRG